MKAPYEVTFQWYPLSYAETAAFSETYGFSGSQGRVNLDAVLMRPANKPSGTVLIFMHPAVTQHGLPVPRALAEQGFHVLCATNRYVKNDSALVLEKVLLDLGAHVRHAKEVLGYKKVVICGWSGGGPLMVFYQSQAEQPSIVDTPAGDPLDIRRAGLIPGDAVIFQAASISRAHILVDVLDPSIVDEADPDNRDLSLDIYNPKNPERPPFSADFITRYREAQLARMRRITANVKSTLDRLNRLGGKERERGFVTHRTLADPRWIDPSIDPNDRKPATSYIGDPETANNGPVGLGRFSTLRSWLSQWSIDDTRGDAVKCAAKLSVPFLAIENSADDGAPQPHVGMVYKAVASRDKAMHVVKGANHYYVGQPELLREACRLYKDFLGARGLVDL